MPLQFDDGASFSSGATTYEYRAVTSRDVHERILVRIRIDGNKTVAMLDTGGVFFVCAPEVAEQLGLDPRHGAPANRVLLRGRILKGFLHPLELELIADKGANLLVTVTAFVPHLRAGEEWFDEFPCILGLYGCLERLRFAVDPFTETFYFGAAL